MEAAAVLPSFASGMRDDVTRQIGVILGKGPALVYPTSRIPTGRDLWNDVPLRFHESGRRRRYPNVGGNCHDVEFYGVNERSVAGQAR